MKGIFPTLMGSNNSTPFGVASQFRRGSFRRFHLRLIIFFPFGERRGGFTPSYGEVNSPLRSYCRL